MDLVPSLCRHVAGHRASLAAWHSRVLHLIAADGKIAPNLSEHEWLALYHSSARQLGVAS